MFPAMRVNIASNIKQMTHHLAPCSHTHTPSLGCQKFNDKNVYTLHRDNSSRTRRRTRMFCCNFSTLFTPAKTTHTRRPSAFIQPA